MTLSRTARILIAALLVAAAAFFWVNFFNQDPVQGPLVTQPSGVVAPLANPVATDQPAEQEGGVTVADTGAAAGSQDQGAPTVAATTPSDTTPVDTSQAGAADQAADATTTTPVVVDTAPPVIVTGTPTVVTRDLVVEDLPFLVTTPPSAVAGQVDAAAASADRPDVSQRSNINPFSPIVVQAPPSAPVQDVVASAPTSEPVIDIVTDGNGQPVASAAQPGSSPVASASSAPVSQVAANQQPAAVVKAPAPRAVAPTSTTVSSLPRPLPSGTLPTTPEILRDARTQTSTATPTLPDVGTLAALRVPEENQPLGLAAADGEIPTDGVVTPELIGPNRPTAAAASGPAIPLAVGADLLSRYLRDNNVTFTGTVLGPLSVGVFRSNLYGTPVVLTLGQTLPDTDILLTDLRGYEARFSLGDRTQTLALDLRR